MNSLGKTQVDLIVQHAKQLVTARGHSETPAIGSEMEDLGLIEEGAVAIKDGKIAAVGNTSDVLGKYSAAKTVDASNKVVTPGFVDAHTHCVFAGSREKELELKIKGASYLEIMHRGGGILRTVSDTRAATKEELIDICRRRARSLLAHGATTIEAKSGYGLNFIDEVKILQVIKQLNVEGPLTLVPTFLGAHAIPTEYHTKTAEYVTKLCEEWIPEIAKLNLAEFCDVFCERGVFEIEDSRRILEAGKRFGLKAKIHADELYPLGGAELAAQVGAVSADHLLFASETGLSEMRRAGVIATLLPAAPLTLMLERYADARRMIAEGVAVALGSDLSPSCWVENHQLIIALACYKLRMTPAEAIMASTINAAHAVRKANAVGSVEIGKDADILLIDAEDYRFLGYSFGRNMVSTVIKRGSVIVENGKLVA